MKLLRTICLTLAVLCAFSLDASAATNIKKGSFTTNSGTPSFNQAVTGVGFQPKAVIFLWTDQTAAGAAANQVIGAGFAAETASTGGVSASVANDDNVSTTNNARIYTSSQCIRQTDSSASADLFNGFLASLDSDGFTITWQVVDPGAGRIIHYIAVGGTDITNAKAMALTLNASTGNQSYTGVGFQPDFGLYVMANTTTSGTNTTNATFGIGWAVSTSKRGSASINADDGVTMTTQMDWNRIIANNLALVVLSNAASTLDIEFDHVSFDSDGVTFNQINAPTVNTILGALFLKGGQYDAGNANVCTGASCTVSPTTAFQPKGVLLLGTALDVGDANRTVTAHQTIVVGAGTSTDGTQEGSVSVNGLDATLPTDANQSSSTTKAISGLSVSGTTTAAEADLTTLGATSFTLTFTTDGSPSAIFNWAVIGDAAAAPSVKPPRRIIITRIEPREYEEAR